MAKQPAKKKPQPRPGAVRPVGKPKFRQRVGTPENLEKIRVCWLEGWSCYQIAKVIGCAPETVWYHIQNSVLPKQKTIWEGRVEEIIAKVDHLYRTCWRQFQRSKAPQTMEQIKHKLEQEGVDGALIERVSRQTTRTGEPCWLDLVKWCLDWLSKVAGIYAAEKVQIENDLRVAGKSRTDIDEEVLGYLAARVAERKRHQASIEATYGKQGGGT